MLLIPAWLAVWSAHVIWLTYSPVPFLDQWANVQAMYDVRETGWLTYLFSQHNEHRILFPRLVFLADWAWFGGRNGLSIAAIGAVQLLGAGFFIHAALRQRPGTLGVFGLAAALAMIASLTQWENLFCGFQLAFVAVYAAGAWAIYLHALAGADAERVHWGAMAGALAFLAVATFSMANGFAAGAAMVLAGLVSRQRPKVILTAAVATAVLFAIYVHDYRQPGSASLLQHVLAHPGRFVFYVAILLGNLWEPVQYGRASLIGLAGMMLSFAILVVLLRSEKRDPVRAALFGVVLFVGMSAAVTSFGRLALGVEQALSSRYVTPATYFWAAQALFWGLTADRGDASWIGLQRTPQAWTLTVERSLGAWARIGLALILGIFIWRLFWLQPIVQFKALAATRERMLAGASALLGGIDDAQSLQGIGPAPTVQRLTPFLRATRTSVFADPVPAKVGQPLRLPIAPSAACRGAFEFLTPTSSGEAWRATGWGWDRTARRTFSRVVLVDHTGRVLGVGGSGIPRFEIPKAIHEVRDVQAGWLSLLRRGDGREVVAYGITPAGAACEIGRKPWV